MESSYPYDAGAGAAVNEAQWQAMARRFLGTGVIGGFLGQLAVTADGSALSVSVATGDAFVEGFMYRNDSALAKPIATANATNPRIDTVVVRLDRTANTAALFVVTGTPAAAPVAPSLSATDSLFDLPLANVLVPAAAGVIVAGNVTDRRGFVKNLTESAASAAYVVRAEALAATAAANESTTSTTFADLATVGPAVTVTVGASGRLLVILSAVAFNGTADAAAVASVALSGVNALAAADGNGFIRRQGTASLSDGRAGHSVLTGLNPGVTTVTMKYRASAGTASFLDRRLVVIPL